MDSNIRDKVMMMTATMTAARMMKATMTTATMTVITTTTDPNIVNKLTMTPMAGTWVATINRQNAGQKRRKEED